MNSSHIVHMDETARPPLELRLLGGMALAIHGKPQRLPQRTATRQVWAFLLLNAGQQIRRDELPARLWPDLSDADGKKALRSGLSFLRDFLDDACGASDRLSADRASLNWTTAPTDTLDVQYFEQTAEAALDSLAGLVALAPDGGSGNGISGDETEDDRTASPSRRRLNLLRRAADGYDGDLLADWPDEWLDEPRRRLRQLHQRVLERLTTEAFSEGAYDEVIRTANLLLSCYPHREHALGRLIAAYYLTGDSPAASKEYARFGDALERELSTAPSADIAAIMAAIERGAPADEVIRLARGPGSFLADLGLDLDLPPVDTAILHGAPRVATNLIGRDQAQAEVIDLASRRRLVTLLGPGGIGKTRLAIESAHSLAKAQTDGAYWVDLTMVSDASQIPGILLATLGITQQAGGPPLDFITAHLAHQSALLILDNCEHVLAEAAQVTTAILARCANVRILATSREPLQHPEEQAYRVPALDLPPEGHGVNEGAVRTSSAVQLFLERAERARPGYGALMGRTAEGPTAASDNPVDPTAPASFDLVDESSNLGPELAAVLAICRKLEGIPLAIELAAALISYMSAPEIAARLDKALGMLVRGSRSSPKRHHTIRAVVDLELSTVVGG